jgi:hypothetical protein
VDEFFVLTERDRAHTDFPTKACPPASLAEGAGRLGRHPEQSGSGIGVEPDERMSEAAALVEKRRHQNGRWPLGILHRDVVPIPFETESGVGTASRWNTLRAMRVLDRYGAQAR